MSDLPSHDAPEALSLCHIDSYEKLDIVLFVHACERPAVLDEIAAGSRMSVADTRRALETLCTAGVLSRQAGGYVCMPLEPALAASVEALVRAYHKDPLAVFASVGKAFMLRRRLAARDRARGYSRARALNPIVRLRGPRS